VLWRWLRRMRRAPDAPDTLRVPMVPTVFRGSFLSAPRPSLLSYDSCAGVGGVRGAESVQTASPRRPIATGLPPCLLLVLLRDRDDEHR
jgi:hypothetical protein